MSRVGPATTSGMMVGPSAVVAQHGTHGKAKKVTVDNKEKHKADSKVRTKEDKEKEQKEKNIVCAYKQESARGQEEGDGMPAERLKRGEIRTNMFGLGKARAKRSGAGEAKTQEERKARRKKQGDRAPAEGKGGRGEQGEGRMQGHMFVGERRDQRYRHR